MGPESGNDLAARGYIRIDDGDDPESPENEHAKIVLTPGGRIVVEQIFNQSERVERDIMEQLGVPQTIALRSLLSRFVRTHSPLIPYRWF